MTLTDITQRITELEESTPTSQHIQALANLYAVRDGLGNIQTDIGYKELSDIFPMYAQYIEIKRKYQRHELTSEAVQDSIKKVCIELSEFMDTLYSGTDMWKERVELIKMLEYQYNKYVKE